jgi:hypothetical protein|tara:strand:+ start:1302 stop:1694 length:393 start_codon:yes stop_codon:yes gene_type:complete
MSLIVDCRFCGERISLRKMPHGKHVPFDVHTDDQHKCTESKSKKKAVKKITKPKKVIVKKTEESYNEEDFLLDDENIVSNDNSPQDIFKDDTLESLKNEIEVETTEKKDNKKIYILVALGVLGLIFFLNN